MTPDRSARRQLLAAVILIAVAIAAVVALSSASAGRAVSPRLVSSMFQDDDHLLYASNSTVAGTLDKLKSLGVSQIRATVLWKALAPDPVSLSPPPGFNGADPAAYPSAQWGPYDRLVILARRRGMTVDFNLTAPGPLWAMARRTPVDKFADHWAPSPQAFGEFVQAVATRYSGHYAVSAGGPALPRVAFWSIWNEPNQPGWLAPQWHRVSGVATMEAPVLYRSYVDGAWRALLSTGHNPAHDTILVGELAPEGSLGPNFGYRTPTPPLSFLRALYCLDSSYQPLQGAAAGVLGCPLHMNPQQFVRTHPGLFQMTGFAHHPYSFFLAPNVSVPDAGFAPLADLGRLERTLDGIYSAYGVNGRLGLWLTEYGYETDPPDPYRGVSPRLQSLYLNEAQYMAFRDPRVRSLCQFLLYDARPDTRHPPGTQGYWSTFQTGLLFADGTAKPSLNSYRLPLFLPDPVLDSGDRVLVWAMLRGAPAGSRQAVEVQWRTQHGTVYRTVLRTTAQRPGEVVAERVRLPGPGVVRVSWTAPDGTAVHSRAVGVRG